MKASTRLLALLLSFVLAFGLALPAFAQESLIENSEATENPAMPVITVQPQGGRVRLGEPYTLSVEAYIPNGDEFGLRWYNSADDFIGNIPVITTTPYSLGTRSYSVVVYNRNNWDCYVQSEIARVEVDANLFEIISEIFKAPVYAYQIILYLVGDPFSHLVSSTVLAPLILLFSPIWAPIACFYRLYTLIFGSEVLYRAG